MAGIAGVGAAATAAAGFSADLCFESQNLSVTK
jgi:hypothetical protein